MRFVPYESAEDPHVVVDGSPRATTVLTLSHWPGMSSPSWTWADTSAEMALAYAAAGSGAATHGDAELVTNNHFDQDGLAGVFALVDPAAALARRALLVDVARAGDFAVHESRSAARVSMAISALARDAAPAPYPEQCAALYAEALELFVELLDHPDRFRRLWKDEDESLAEAEAAVDAGRVSVQEVADLDLAVVTVDPVVGAAGGHRFGGSWTDGLHPMALHRLTSCVRLLVAHGDTYRYTDRYETWVQYRSRPLPQRRDLRPLAEELQAAEPGAVAWTATAPSDLAPELVAVGSELSLDDVTDAVARHLRTAPAAWDPSTGS